MIVQAALCLQEGAPLEIRAVELDPPGPGEVLVRWHASGICASDHFVIRHANWPKPYIPGHEGAGVVETVGPGVATLAVGDHVVSDLLGACGQCRQCRTGRPRLCEPQRQRAGAGHCQSLPSERHPGRPFWPSRDCHICGSLRRAGGFPDAHSRRCAP